MNRLIISTILFLAANTAAQVNIRGTVNAEGGLTGISGARVSLKNQPDIVAFTE